MGDLGLIPGLGISPGEGKSYVLQYSILENSVDCLAHGVAKSYYLQWEIDGETVETVSDFIFLGSKITADGDCSHYTE